jgi:hypothetical protein
MLHLQTELAPSLLNRQHRAGSHNGTSQRFDLRFSSAIARYFMEIDGADTDTKKISNLFHSHSLRQKSENLALPVGNFQMTSAVTRLLEKRLD